MTQPLQAPTTRLRGPGSLRILLLGLVSIGLAISVALVISATSPATSPVSAVGPGSADANGFVGLAPGQSPDGSFAAGGPGPGAMGYHSITIAAINGSQLSLKTTDGWSRSITVDSSTVITKAGATIGVGDLNVGDTIAFREAKQSDGSFKITDVRVLVPHVAGQVTALDSGSITLKLRDGSSQTITVNGATKYFIDATAAGQADVKVGSNVDAAGTVSGSTFTALTVTIRTAPVRPVGPNASGAPHLNGPSASGAPGGGPGFGGRGGFGGGPGFGGGRGFGGRGGNGPAASQAPATGSSAG